MLLNVDLEDNVSVGTQSMHIHQKHRLSGTLNTIKTLSHWIIKTNSVMWIQEIVFQKMNAAGKINSLILISNCLYSSCAKILEQSMGARNRVGMGLSYRPARARICKPFKKPRNRFLAWRAGTSILFVVLVRQATFAGGINSSGSIPGLLESLRIRAQSRKLKSRYGARNQFQEPSLELSSQAT